MRPLTDPEAAEVSAEDFGDFSSMDFTDMFGDIFGDLFGGQEQSQPDRSQKGRKSSDRSADYPLKRLYSAVKRR